MAIFPYAVQYILAYLFICLFILYIIVCVAYPLPQFALLPFSLPTGNH